MTAKKHKQKIFQEMLRLFDSGATCEQIAGRLSLKLKTVEKVLGVWVLHSAGYTDLAIGRMLGIHQTTVGRIRCEWTGLAAHVRGRPPEPERRISFINSCYGIRFNVRAELLARQSCYSQLYNGTRILQLDGPTDLPCRIRVLSETQRLPRTKLS